MGREVRGGTKRDLRIVVYVNVDKSLSVQYLSEDSEVIVLNFSVGKMTRKNGCQKISQ